MSSFRIGNKHYKIIPFLITTGTLLFFVFWIGGISYKYHLETEERRKLQEVDIKAKARELNNDLHNENKKLKKENEYMKDTPYEFQRDNGEKEYYNLFTNKLVKKIDKDDTIWEYDKNNGLLLKKTDRYNNVEEYGSHGKLIKKTLSDGVWMEYNPVNAKMMKRKNIDGSLEEFNENEKKIKETQYDKETGKIQYLIDFDVNTGKKVKQTQYDKESGKIQYLTDFDVNTGNVIKETRYDDYGKILYIEEYEKETGKRIKRTYYLDDGKTIKNIDEYDKNTGKKVKETQYDEYEKILYIEEYEKETGKRIKETHYLDDGKTIEKIIECDKNTGNVIKVIKETHL